MALFTRPDIYVIEELRAPVRTSTTAPDAPVGAFVGAAWKGPDVGPVLLNSWTEYQQTFGGFNNAVAGGITPLAYAVHQFFVQGGGSCYVQRVTDGTAVTATVTLEDQNATPEGTLQVDAYSKGAWANEVYVSIVEAPTSGRFDIIVYDGPAIDGNIAERFTDLAMAASDSRYAPAVVNSATRGSKFITLTDLASVSVPPDNAPLAGTFQLASGADGSAPDETNVTTAIDRLDAIPGGMIVNIPGVVDPDVIGALVAFCEGRGNAFAVIDTAAGDTPADAVTFAGTITPASSYAAVYWPHVVVPDSASSRAGSTAVLPPGGSVVGIFSRTDASRGPQKTPAGIEATVRGAVGLGVEATDDELGALNVGSVNALRQFPAAGINILGGRTLKTTGADRYISVRRSLIFIKETLSQMLLFALFENNDQILWSTASNEASRLLTEFWQNGGLKGQSAEQAFFVKCDEETNPQQSVEEGEFHMEVGVALEFPAEFIILKIGQFEAGTITVTEG